MTAWCSGISKRCVKKASWGRKGRSKQRSLGAASRLAIGNYTIYEKTRMEQIFRGQTVVLYKRSLICLAIE
jgi:hypothetical protein